MPASLISEHGEVSVKHKVDHLIGGRTVVLVAEPVHRHLWGAHGIEHEILEVLEFVCHVPIISTGSDGSLVLVCHLVNWSEAADLGINQR